jgi:non-canonical (house-cleaning) NTP pyrophosphatase
MASVKRPLATAEARAAASSSEDTVPNAALGAGAALGARSDSLPNAANSGGAYRAPDSARFGRHFIDRFGFGSAFLDARSSARPLALHRDDLEVGVDGRPRLTVVVTSEKPVHAAAAEAFVWRLLARLCPDAPGVDLVVVPIHVGDAMPPQPLGEHETLRGAMRRCEDPRVVETVDAARAEARTPVVVSIELGLVAETLDVTSMPTEWRSAWGNIYQREDGAVWVDRAAVFAVVTTRRGVVRSASGWSEGVMVPRRFVDRARACGQSLTVGQIMAADPVFRTRGGRTISADDWHMQFVGRSRREFLQECTRAVPLEIIE